MDTIKESLNFNLLLILFLAVFSPYNTFSQSSPIQFTEEEKAWISANPEISVGNERFWPPIDFYSDGKAMGYSIDLMDLIAQKIGLKINYVSGLSWSELLEAFNSETIDVLPAISKTDERETYIKFSKPYVKLPYVKVINSSIENDDNNNLEGKSVAVFKGSNIENAMTLNYPSVKLVYLNSIEEALQKVSTGEVDVFIENLAVVNYYLDQSYFPNIKLNSNNLNFLSSSEVFIGVLKKNKILGNLIDKGFNAIPKDELDKIHNKWLSVNETSVKKNDLITPDNLWKIIIYGIIVFVIIIIIIRLILKKFTSERISLEFGSRRFRTVTILGMFFIILTISLIGWWAMEHNKKKILEDLEINLETTLANTHERLISWVDQYRALIQQLGRDPELVEATNQILKISNDKSKLISSQALNETRSFYIKHEDKLHSVGFFIIDKKFINIASTKNSNIGIENLIYIHKPDLINQVFMGNSVFIPPIRPEGLLNESKGEDITSKSPTMFFVAPIQNNLGEVIAALAIQVDPAAGFSKVMQLSRVGKTGESYAFNNEGRLLSESRFDDDLREIGLVSKDGQGILQIEIRDPGGNMVNGFKSEINRHLQPLTRMAESATNGESDTDLNGYRDYRGVQVYGAWIWSKDF